MGKDHERYGMSEESYNRISVAKDPRSAKPPGTKPRASNPEKWKDKRANLNTGGKEPPVLREAKKTDELTDEAMFEAAVERSVAELTGAVELGLFEEDPHGAFYPEEAEDYDNPAWDTVLERAYGGYLHREASNWVKARIASPEKHRDLAASFPILGNKTAAELGVRVGKTGDVGLSLHHQSLMNPGMLVAAELGEGAFRVKVKASGVLEAISKSLSSVDELLGRGGLNAYARVLIDHLTDDEIPPHVKEYLKNYLKNLEDAMARLVVRGPGRVPKRTMRNTALSVTAESLKAEFGVDHTRNDSKKDAALARTYDGKGRILALESTSSVIEEALHRLSVDLAARSIEGIVLQFDNPDAVAGERQSYYRRWWKILSDAIKDGDHPLHPFVRSNP